MIDLASGRVSQVEALVRWQHPARGLLGVATAMNLASQQLTPLLPGVIARDLPVHEVKLDISFITRLGRNERDERVVAGMIRTAHSSQTLRSSAPTLL